MANITAWGGVIALGLSAALFVPSAPAQQPGAAADLMATRRIIAAFACTVPGYVQVRRGGRGGPVTTNTIRAAVDETLGAMALAERPAGSETLYIWANPHMLVRFAPVTQVFWLAHECAHHTLSHTQSRGYVSDTCASYREKAADCEAVAMMKTGANSLVTATSLAIIEADLRTQLKIKDPGGLYLGGPARADLVDVCFRDQTRAQSLIAQGHCEASTRHQPSTRK